MVKNIRHKGLQALYEEDSARGVRPDQVKRLKQILARLDASQGPEDMDLPGLRPHALTGNLAGFHSVSVSGNWRVIFRFDAAGDACDLDWVDDH